MKLTKSPVPDFLSTQVPGGAAVLVAEDLGGIVAYIDNFETARKVARSLNEAAGVGPDVEKPPFYTFDFDPNVHWDGFFEVRDDGELANLHMDGDRIGYVLTGSPEIAKLLRIA